MRGLLLSVLLLFCFTLRSQYVPIVIQDFDTILTPAWNYTGNGLTYIRGNSSATDLMANSPFGLNGSWCWETNAQIIADTMTFANVPLSGYDSVYIEFRVAAFSINSPTNGLDQLDYIMAKVSVDGGATYYNRVRVSGSNANENYWPYAATGIGLDTFAPVSSPKLIKPAATGLAMGDGPSTIRIRIPSNYTQVRLQLLSRESTVNERWCVDNVSVMGIPMSASAPNAAFAASQSNLCPGGCVSFTDQSTFGPTSWSWSFPGAAISSSILQHPTGICYMTPGTYTATLIAANQYGQDTISHTLTVSLPDTSVSVSGGTFTANAAGATYQWYNCGSASNVPGATSQSYSPSNTGDYAVIVTANGCTDTSSCHHYVQPPSVPVAAFTSSASNICAGGCISFFDQTVNSPASWNWTFPGSSVPASTQQNPAAICYASAGTFTATLIVTNGAGSDTVSHTITVTMVDTSVSIAGSTFTANATGSTYQWFNCGSGSNVPGATSQNFTPSNSGNYSVIVTTNGCSDTSSCYNYVQPPTIPVAAFSPSSTSVCAGSCITYQDQSINTPNSWHWDLQGAVNTVSTQQNPGSVCYNTAGTFTSTLIVSNGAGADTVSHTITVTSVDTSVSISGSTLTANAVGARYRWFNCTSGQALPADTNQVYNPSQAGSYCVIVTENGCTDTSNCHVVSIAGQPPIANISVSQSTVCPGGCVTFSQNTFNNPTSWQWNFPGGNPSSSTSQVPSQVCYPTAGTYVAELIATNGSGSDTAQLSITVNTADTLRDTFAICLGQTFTFADGTTATTAGTHTSSLTSGQGCDSIIVTTLQVRTVNRNVLQSGNLLTSLAANSTYQWINCSGNVPVNGATAQQFSATQSGSYAVIVTQNNCSDTSNCYAVVINGIAAPAEMQVQVYPVPFREKIQVDAEAPITEAELFDLSGKRIVYMTAAGRKHLEIETAQLSAGIYTLRLTSESGAIIHRKLSKE